MKKCCRYFKFHTTSRGAILFLPQSTYVRKRQSWLYTPNFQFPIHLNWIENNDAITDGWEFLYSEFPL